MQSDILRVRLSLQFFRQNYGKLLVLEVGEFLRRKILSALSYSKSFLGKP
jgi:hypothetical protein